MKIALHVITLLVAVALTVSGFFAWRFGLELIEDQTFHYDGIVKGEIIRSKPEDAGNHVTPGLRYVFEVGGHVVHGQYYRQNLITKKELSKARAIAAALKPGSKIDVYYRVGAAGEVHSVLNPHPDPMAHLLYVGGIPLSLFVIGLYLTVVVMRPRSTFGRSRDEQGEKNESKDDEEKKPEKASEA